MILQSFKDMFLIKKKLWSVFSFIDILPTAKAGGF
jgi:hypothetical protein